MKNLILSFFLMLLAFPAFAASGEKESTYERVMRTGTIRCGYILLPPEMIKDVNTGEFSGLSYDIMTEIGRRLDLKIDWAEEVNFQTLAEGLKTGRYDAVCFSLYRYTQQAKFVNYTTPLFFSETGVFVRADDTRFDDYTAKINDPATKISVIDGEMSQFIAAEEFPEAQTLSMPQLTDLSQMLVNVETKKADVAFINLLVADHYLKNNPGKLKNLAAYDPIRVFSHGFVYPKGEYDLGKMLDVAIEEMHDHGFIDKVLNKYDPEGRTYLRLQRPYRKGE
ncbi:MAG: transporter substrate-binding domain-containing protein [Rhodospirillales bacterium]|nr:transporter substrate-binding domain-containing protein [Rhodospirillales bacterium]